MPDSNQRDCSDARDSISQSASASSPETVISAEEQIADEDDSLSDPYDDYSFSSDVSISDEETGDESSDESSVRFALSVSSTTRDTQWTRRLSKSSSRSYSDDSPSSRYTESKDSPSRVHCQYSCSQTTQSVGEVEGKSNAQPQWEIFSSPSPPDSWWCDSASIHSTTFSPHGSVSTPSSPSCVVSGSFSSVTSSSPSKCKSDEQTNICSVRLNVQDTRPAELDRNVSKCKSDASSSCLGESRASPGSIQPNSDRVSDACPMLGEKEFGEFSSPKTPVLSEPKLVYLKSISMQMELQAPRPAYPTILEFRRTLLHTPDKPASPRKVLIRCEYCGQPITAFPLFDRNSALDAKHKFCCSEFREFTRRVSAEISLLEAAAEVNELIIDVSEKKPKQPKKISEFRHQEFIKKKVQLLQKLLKIQANFDAVQHEKRKILEEKRRKTMEMIMKGSLMYGGSSQMYGSVSQMHSGAKKLSWAFDSDSSESFEERKKRKKKKRKTLKKRGGSGPSDASDIEDIYGAYGSSQRGSRKRKKTSPNIGRPLAGEEWRRKRDFPSRTSSRRHASLPTPRITITPKRRTQSLNQDALSGRKDNFPEDETFTDESHGVNAIRFFWSEELARLSRQHQLSSEETSTDSSEEEEESPTQSPGSRRKLRKAKRKSSEITGAQKSEASDERSLQKETMSRVSQRWRQATSPKGFKVTKFSLRALLESTGLLTGRSVSVDSPGLLPGRSVSVESTGLFGQSVAKSPRPPKLHVTEELSKLGSMSAVTADVHAAAIPEEAVTFSLMKDKDQEESKAREVRLVQAPKGVPKQGKSPLRPGLFDMKRLSKARKQSETMPSKSVRLVEEPKEALQQERSPCPPGLFDVKALSEVYTQSEKIPSELAEEHKDVFKPRPGLFDMKRLSEVPVESETTPSKGEPEEALQQEESPRPRRPPLFDKKRLDEARRHSEELMSKEVRLVQAPKEVPKQEKSPPRLGLFDMKRLSEARKQSEATPSKLVWLVEEPKEALQQEQSPGPPEVLDMKALSEVPVCIQSEIEMIPSKEMQLGEAPHKVRKKEKSSRCPELFQMKRLSEARTQPENLQSKEVRIVEAPKEVLTLEPASRRKGLFDMKSPSQENIPSKASRRRKSRSPLEKRIVPPNQLPTSTEVKDEGEEKAKAEEEVEISKQQNDMVDLGVEEERMKRGDTLGEVERSEEETTGTGGERRSISKSMLASKHRKKRYATKQKSKETTPMKKGLWDLETGDSDSDLSSANSAAINLMNMEMIKEMAREVARTLERERRRSLREQHSQEEIESESSEELEVGAKKVKKRRSKRKKRSRERRVRKSSAGTTMGAKEVRRTSLKEKRRSSAKEHAQEGRVRKSSAGTTMGAKEVRRTSLKEKRRSSAEEYLQKGRERKRPEGTTVGAKKVGRTLAKEKRSKRKKHVREGRKRESSEGMAFRAKEVARIWLKKTRQIYSREETERERSDETTVSATKERGKKKKRRKSRERTERGTKDRKEASIAKTTGRDSQESIVEMGELDVDSDVTPVRQMSEMADIARARKKRPVAKRRKDKRKRITKLRRPQPIEEDGGTTELLGETAEGLVEDFKLDEWSKSPKQTKLPELASKKKLSKNVQSEEKHEDEWSESPKQTKLPELASKKKLSKNVQSEEKHEDEWSESPKQIKLPELASKKKLSKNVQSEEKHVEAKRKLPAKSKVSPAVEKKSAQDALSSSTSSTSEIFQLPRLGHAGKEAQAKSSSKASVPFFHVEEEGTLSSAGTDALCALTLKQMAQVATKLTTSTGIFAERRSSTSSCTSATAQRKSLTGSIALDAAVEKALSTTAGSKIDFQLVKALGEEIMRHTPQKTILSVEESLPSNVPLLSPTQIVNLAVRLSTLISAQNIAKVQAAQASEKTSEKQEENGDEQEDKEEITERKRRVAKKRVHHEKSDTVHHEKSDTVHHEKSDTVHHEKSDSVEDSYSSDESGDETIQRVCGDCSMALSMHEIGTDKIDIEPGSVRDECDMCGRLFDKACTAIWILQEAIPRRMGKSLKQMCTSTSNVTTISFRILDKHEDVDQSIPSTKERRKFKGAVKGSSPSRPTKATELREEQKRPPKYLTHISNRYQKSSPRASDETSTRREKSPKSKTTQFPSGLDRSTTPRNKMQLRKTSRLVKYGKDISPSYGRIVSSYSLSNQKLHKYAHTKPAPQTAEGTAQIKRELSGKSAGTFMQSVLIRFLARSKRRQTVKRVDAKLLEFCLNCRNSIVEMSPSKEVDVTSVRSKITSKYARGCSMCLIKRVLRRGKRLVRKITAITPSMPHWNRIVPDEGSSDSLSTSKIDLGTWEKTEEVHPSKPGKLLTHVPKKDVKRGRSTTFSADADMVNTIQYRLSSRTFWQLGWTRPPPLHQDWEKLLEKFLPPLASDTNMLRSHQNMLVERFYDNGVKFVTLLPDGTGQIYFPSGNTAIVISSTIKERATYIVLEDVKVKPRIMACFCEWGLGFWEYTSGEIRVGYNRSGGVEVDRNGNKQQHWQWWEQNIAYPTAPFHPVSSRLNGYMGVHALSQDHIVLNFRAKKNCCRFEVGCCVNHEKQVAFGRVPDPMDAYMQYLKQAKGRIAALLAALSTLTTKKLSPRILPPIPRSDARKPIYREV